MDRGDDGTAKGPPKGSRPGNRSGQPPDSVVTGRNAKRWEPGFFKEPRAKQQKLDYFPWSCDLCTLPCPDGEEPSYRRIFDDTFRPVMVVGGQKMSVAAAVVDVAESCSAWRSRINMLMAEDTGPVVRAVQKRSLTLPGCICLKAHNGTISYGNRLERLEQVAALLDRNPLGYWTGNHLAAFNGPLGDDGGDRLTLFCVDRMRSATVHHLQRKGSDQDWESRVAWHRLLPGPPPTGIKSSSGTNHILINHKDGTSVWTTPDEHGSLQRLFDLKSTGLVDSCMLETKVHVLDSSGLVRVYDPEEAAAAAFTKAGHLQASSEGAATLECQDGLLYLTTSKTLLSMDPRSSSPAVELYRLPDADPEVFGGGGVTFSTFSTVKYAATNAAVMGVDPRMPGVKAIEVCHQLNPSVTETLAIPSGVSTVSGGNSLDYLFTYWPDSRVAMGCIDHMDNPKGKKTVSSLFGFEGQSRPRQRGYPHLFRPAIAAWDYRCEEITDRLDLVCTGMKVITTGGPSSSSSSSSLELFTSNAVGDIFFARVAKELSGEEKSSRGSAASTPYWPCSEVSSGSLSTEEAINRWVDDLRGQPGGACCSRRMTVKAATKVFENPKSLIDAHSFEVEKVTETKLRKVKASEAGKVMGRKKPILRKRPVTRRKKGAEPVPAGPFSTCPALGLVVTKDQVCEGNQANRVVATMFGDHWFDEDKAVISRRQYLSPDDQTDLSESCPSPDGPPD